MSQITGAQSLVKSLEAAGVDVMLAGPMPTPAVAYLTRALRLQAGVVISASHNPFDYNVIKFFSASGNKLPDEIELAIEAELEKGMECVSSDALGKAHRLRDANGRYIEFCKSTFPSELDLRGLKIVVDSANGAGYHVAAKVFHELGAEVIAIGDAAVDLCSTLARRIVQHDVECVDLPLASGDATEAMIDELIPLLKSGDTIIDGGNSNFHDTIRRHEKLAGHGIHFVDAGTSGGVWGLENGYCMMVGGDAAPVQEMEPIFTTLAPKDGYMHCGPSGAGHYVKMVHNGIEYGLMQSYAEGFEILAKSRYDLDLAKVSDLWMQGSVVRSWLLELAARAFRAEGSDLKGIKGWVADSGEGRWTVQEAIDLDVPAPLITLSLLTRFRSRQEDSYAAKVLAALRNQFGGHAVKPE